ncbi:Putative signal transducing protein [Maribacter sedimenticola]|uniref:Signal transducing protein n=1 Tax=Maribacter sedimenticola TaxID=228956 RepID=A0ABY1SLQ4_9FLAO|nr:DUF2007 domain-containing protein [Maribacter sedimenticola]SNR77335.1 Putative signal transducing protein [Maribacter sedimenticola]
MNTTYKKIFGGDRIKANRVELTLRDGNIIPICKDEGESARLAGFSSSLPQFIEIYVHEDEEVKALSLISNLEWDN